LRQLAELKFTQPSEIQRLLIPRALTGVDLLGQARTGTGKTAAFGIPVLQMAKRDLEFQAIILVPTRELCVQVESELQRIAAQTPLRILAVYGGQKISAQVKHLRTGPEILVGTPGRVIDLLERRLIHFANIRFVVLDEVDRMLDIGFRDDIRRLLARVKNARDASTPSDTAEGDEVDRSVQTIFVSATISPEIEKLARTFMREPVEKLIAPGADDKPTVDKVEQYVLTAQPWDKYRALRALLEKEKPELAIVFCRTKHGAEKVAHMLTADGIDCREIHGNLKQTKRDKVMKSFRTGKFDVLVATDLASRGIDVQDITHIINYDIPEDPEVYVHRIGRTARMGAEGKAYTFVTRQQGEELTRVENLINMVIPTLKLDNFTERPEPNPGRYANPDSADTAPGTVPADGTPAAPAVPPKPPAKPIGLGGRHPVRRRRL
jgi:ATP-dependent RNA helicase DeaD